MPVLSQTSPRRALARSPQRAARRSVRSLWPGAVTSPASLAAPLVPDAGPRVPVAALVTGQRLLLNASALLGALALVLVVGGFAVGLRPTVVISGSMAPSIPVGAITLHQVVPADSLAVGDVVTVAQPDGHGLVTHRVVEMDTSGASTLLTLKGDANQEADPEPYDVFEAGKVKAVIPVLGHVALAVKRHPAATILALIALTAVALAPLDRLGRPAPERRAHP